MWLGYPFLPFCKARIRAGQSGRKPSAFLPLTLVVCVDPLFFFIHLSGLGTVSVCLRMAGRRSLVPLGFRQKGAPGSRRRGQKRWHSCRHEATREASGLSYMKKSQAHEQGRTACMEARSRRLPGSRPSASSCCGPPSKTEERIEQYMAKVAGGRLPGAHVGNCGVDCRSWYTSVSATGIKMPMHTIRGFESCPPGQRGGASVASRCCCHIRICEAPSR